MTTQADAVRSPQEGIETVLSAVALTTEFYDIYERDEAPGSVRIRSRKCPMLDAARRLGSDGLPEAAFCHPHELYYQDWIDDLGLPLHFKFTKAMGRGDSHCEWVIKVEDTDDAPTGEA